MIAVFCIGLSSIFSDILSNILKKTTMGQPQTRLYILPFFFKYIDFFLVFLNYDGNNSEGIMAFFIKMKVPKDK